MHTSLSWLVQVRLLQAIFRALQLPHVAVRDFARSSEEATSLQKIYVVHRLQQTFPLIISSYIYMVLLHFCRLYSYAAILLPLSIDDIGICQALRLLSLASTGGAVLLGPLTSQLASGKLGRCELR